MKVYFPISVNSIPSYIEFYDEVLEMDYEATEYLNGFKWCKKIKEKYLYYNLGSTLCVFLFDIENKQSKEKGDSLLWVIVGDLPSMYLDTFNVKTLKEALETYIDLANDWADKIITKQQMENCFPFEVKPTIKLAKALKSRVKFIKNNLMKNITDVDIVDL
jgi:hypothetical protein